MSQRHDEAIERGRIPEPPSTWYPLGSVNLSSQGETRTPSLGSVSESGNTSAQRRGRGPSQLHDSWSKGGGKIIIEQNDKGQPVMSETSCLASKLGVLARDCCLLPLHYLDWRYVPPHYKKRVWDEIKAHTNANDSMEKWFMQSVGKKWAGWKYEAKRQGYAPFHTDAERLAHRPTRVTEQQWRCLIYHWGDRDVQAKSEKNKNIRSEQTLLHTSGRTPHYLVEKKEKEQKKDLTRIDLFVKTHTKKSGDAVNEATGLVMKKLLDLRSSQQGCSSPIISEDTMFTEAIGAERHGRVRGYGLGVTRAQLLYAKNQNQAPTHPPSLNQEIMKMKSKLNKFERAFRAMGYTLEDSDDDLDEPLPNNNPPDASSTHRQMTSNSHRTGQLEIDPRPETLLSGLIERPNCMSKSPNEFNEYRELTPNSYRHNQLEIDPRPEPLLSPSIERLNSLSKSPIGCNEYREVTPNNYRHSQPEIDSRSQLPMQSIGPTPLSQPIEQLDSQIQFIRRGKRKRFQKRWD